MVASKSVGLVQLKQAVSQTPLPKPGNRAPQPESFESAAQALAKVLPVASEIALPEALLLLSLHDQALENLAGHDRRVVEATTTAQGKLRAEGLDPISAPVEARYDWIQKICRKSVHGAASGELTISDKLDAILTHKIWGWAAFLVAMTLMFFAIFTVAQYPMDWIDAGQAKLQGWVGSKMAPGDFQSLIADGVIAGVGGVVIFLPQILILYMFLGLLEDSGYMARAAFIMDRLMSRVGLHGKSFIPLLSSFACAIPGIMATRTVENPKDRLVTILVAPLMSCSARLPVYTLMIAVLMPVASAWQKAGIMLSMYLLGIFAAFGMAWLFKRTLLKGETPMLLLEMPPYRMPSLRTILLRMVERAGIFLRRAGTIILALSIILWALITYPKPSSPETPKAEAIAHSFAGKLGHAIEPVIAPLGYDWKIGIGLIGSFAAREVFVGTMAIVYNVENEDEENIEPLRDTMMAEKRADGTAVFTPLVCIGLMVFYVLAMQCISTLAIVKRETNSWRWPAFQLAYMTVLAYVGALLVYQGGRIFGFQ